MAKKSELKTVQSVSATDLRRVVTDIARHKENASENAGLAGQAAKLGIERHGLDAKALNIVTGLSKKDAAKAQITALCVLTYSIKLGIFDQIDAFNEHLSEAAELLNQIASGEPVDGETEKPKADPALTTILGGGAPH